MGFVLNCESGASTLDSLSNGFSCTEEALRAALLAIDLDHIYQKHWQEIDIPSKEYLYNYVAEKFGNHRSLASVCWFHLTRTTEDNEFENGILPLGESLEFVWEMVLCIAKDKQVRNNLALMKRSGVSDYHYKTKSRDVLHWGPYGILVRDVAHHSRELSQHDYLGMPEIVEDICNGYQKQFGTSILGLYEEALIPKIVKFKSSNRLDAGCLEAAIYFAYRYIRGLPPCRGAVTCFDGNGASIPPENILSVSVSFPTTAVLTG